MCGSACMCTHACVHMCVCIHVCVHARMCILLGREHREVQSTSLKPLFSQYLCSVSSGSFGPPAKPAESVHFFFIFYSFPFLFLPKLTKEIMVLKNRDLKNNEGSRLALRSPGLRTGKGLGA